MWEWLTRIYRSIVNFLFNRRAENNNQQGTTAKIVTELGVPELAKLKKEALDNAEVAKQLLLRTDMKQILSYDEICELLSIHGAVLASEHKLPIILKSLTDHQVPLVKIAKHSAKNALTLLKSRFVSVFEADELADIYYLHRKDEAFQQAILQASKKNPDPNCIPSLGSILKKAEDKGVEFLKTTYGKICRSAGLLTFLFLEMKNQQKEEIGSEKEEDIDLEAKAPRSDRPEHKKPKVKLPAIDPYLVLGVVRDASLQDIKDAFREKALVLHPDKGLSVEGNRFKALNEAYEFLKVPGNKKAWDDAHPALAHDDGAVEAIFAEANDSIRRLLQF